MFGENLPSPLPRVAFWSLFCGYLVQILTPTVYFVETPPQVEIVSITALNLARMELELDLHLQQVNIPSQIRKTKNTIPITKNRRNTQEWEDDRCRFRILPRQETVITLQGVGLQNRCYLCHMC